MIPPKDQQSRAAEEDHRHAATFCNPDQGKHEEQGPKQDSFPYRSLASLRIVATSIDPGLASPSKESPERVND